VRVDYHIPLGAHRLVAIMLDGFFMLVLLCIVMATA
jgi:hypothetical protein